MALPPLRPASPKTTLILIAVVVVSVAVQVGSILFAELSQPVQPGRTVAPREPERQDLKVPDPIAEPGLDAETGFGEGVFPPREAAGIVEPVVAAGSDRITGAAALAAALTSGEETTVILAALDRAADCGGVGEFLLERAMEKNLSVAVVDAASGVISQKSGITDLSAGDVDFGEVVFTSPDAQVSEVFWGHLPKIATGSDRPATLVEALADICEVVVVFAQRVNIGSSLPVFGGLDATLVLVAGKTPDPGEAEAIARDASALGFERSMVLVAKKRSAEVA